MELDVRPRLSRKRIGFRDETRVYRRRNLRDGRGTQSTQHYQDNTQGSLHVRLRGKCCRADGSDTKVRIHLPTHFRFYYPDTHVTCEPNSPEDSFQDNPVVLFEVLSRSTRRIDEGEKKDAYLTIPSLRVYGLIEQETAAVVVFRRGPSGFVREVYEGLNAVLPLSEIDIELPLAEIYDGVEFSPEVVEAEDR